LSHECWLPAGIFQYTNAHLLVLFSVLLRWSLWNVFQKLFTGGKHSTCRENCTFASFLRQM